MTARHAKAQAFLESLLGDPPRLPYEPTLLPELFAGTAADSDTPVSAVADLVNRSQGLAAQVLRLANSAYYGLRSEISSLTRAIQILGLNEVRAIILGLGISGMAKGMKLPPAFPMRALWEHHVRTAGIARALGRATQQCGTGKRAAGPEDLYAAGLLHDLGKVLVAARCPEDWQAIADLAARESIPFFQAEDAYWGLDHSVTGARLLSFWQIPDRLTEPVSWHHAPHLAAEDHAHGARLLAAANILAADNALDAEKDDCGLPAAVASLLPSGCDPAEVRAALAAAFDLRQAHGMPAWLTEKI